MELFPTVAACNIFLNLIVDVYISCRIVQTSLLQGSGNRSDVASCLWSISMLKQGNHGTWTGTISSLRHKALQQFSSFSQAEDSCHSMTDCKMEQLHDDAER
eukprot:2397249-Amphidinium_carterae.1